ncbi:hypothetical protein GCM10009422_00810 [Brevundimonas kwangchunensis]|uniref:Uncharacterized protein n=1 Tax=Brevundimonas kwangchunensis TaxID=322163 RepID=A0ABN3GJJ4_9CAUL
MRRARHLLFGLSVTALVAGASVSAQAQNAPAAQDHGLRYLSWNGRETSPQAAPTDVRRDVRRDLRRSNRVIPHGGAAEALATPRAGLTPAPGGNRSSLTPASAWLDRTPAPAADAPPPPARRVAPAPAPAPARTPPPAPVVADAPPPPTTNGLPEYVASPNGGQPVPADVIASDPMAPRRDAPIFHMQGARADAAQTPAPPSPRAEAREAARTEPEPRPRAVALVEHNPSDRPAPQGARYYSVHRQNGQTPDAIAMPQSTYVDALTITNIPETTAGQDLAQPVEPPAMIRDAQGRVRVQPAAPEGDYQ